MRQGANLRVEYFLLQTVFILDYTYIIKNNIVLIESEVPNYEKDKH